MSGSDNPVGEPTTYNLLFVCTGNTCRSALAEGIAHAAIERRGWRHVAIQSAGTGASYGAPASDEAFTVAAEHDIDLSAHRSQPLTAELVAWADTILAMGPSHMQSILAYDAGTKAALLTGFIDGDGAGAGEPIEDPYGSDVETYRTTYAQLDTAIEAMLDRLSAILDP